MVEEKDVKDPTDTSTVEKTESKGDEALKARISELSAEKKEAQEQVQALSGQVTSLLEKLNKPAETEEESMLTPEEKKTRLNLQQTRAALGATLDKLDKIETLTDPKINQKEYSKLSAEIEKKRIEVAKTTGQVFSRKEIFFLLKGQQEKPEEEEKEPEEKKPMPETKTTTPKDTKPASEKTTQDLETDLKDKVF